jgi:hypothetical protein
VEDIQLINKRLQELNKEFRDLSALKKKITDESRKTTIKDKYGEYKFMIKSSTLVEPIDFDKLIDEANLQVGKNKFGLPVISYSFGNGVSYFSIVKDKEEVMARIAVDRLLEISLEVEEKFKENTEVASDVQNVLNLFESALELETSAPE